MNDNQAELIITFHEKPYIYKINVPLSLSDDEIIDKVAEWLPDIRLWAEKELMGGK